MIAAGRRGSGALTARLGRRTIAGEAKATLAGRTGVELALRHRHPSSSAANCRPSPSRATCAITCRVGNEHGSWDALQNAMWLERSNAAPAPLQRPWPLCDCSWLLGRHPYSCTQDRCRVFEVEPALVPQRAACPSRAASITVTSSSTASGAPASPHHFCTPYAARAHGLSDSFVFVENVIQGRSASVQPLPTHGGNGKRLPRRPSTIRPCQAVLRPQCTRCAASLFACAAEEARTEPSSSPPTFTVRS